MASKNNNPKARETELVVQELKDELLIYDLTTNKAFCLNQTSAAIWNLCDGNNSVADITKQAGKKLKQAVTDDLVWLALDQFKADNLLDSNQKIEIKFDGLSRREVIRKVGFASLVALPVIASLVAPTAAMAQSLLAIGASCTSSAQCTSNTCFGFCREGNSDLCLREGETCTATGFCFGVGVCSSGGGACSASGAPCFGTNGTSGTCNFTGTCTAGGGTCSTSNGAPCSILSTCAATCR
jgi:hypothetical protein